MKERMGTKSKKHTHRNVAGWSAEKDFMLTRMGDAGSWLGSW